MWFFENFKNSYHGKYETRGRGILVIRVTYLGLPFGIGHESQLAYKFRRFPSKTDENGGFSLK